MTYGEIVSQIKTIVNRGIWPDDDRLSGRYVIQTVLRKRARVLKQEQEKKKLEERFSIQRIHCMELIDADKHECECLPIKTTCKIKRTKKKVPTPIKDYISSVTSIDGEILYSPTTFQNYTQYSRLKPLVEKPRYYITNEYIYIINDDDKQYISVEGVFENPSEVALSSCDGELSSGECYDALAQELSVAPDLVDSIVAMSIEEILTTMKYGQEDKINDAMSSYVDYTQLKQAYDKSTANRSSQS